MNNIYHYLKDAYIRFPNRDAIISPNENKRCNYKKLYEDVEKLSLIFSSLSLRKHDRVALLITKSIVKVESIFAVLKLNSIYVPLDQNAPFKRNLQIIKDCQPKLILSKNHFIEILHKQADLTFKTQELDEDAIIIIYDIQYKEIKVIYELLDNASHIIYTSGSTGVPKGVLHTHKSTMGFIDWCSEVFKPLSNDVFSSHASFHFDLSTFDLFLSIKHGASVVLINHKEAKNPLFFSSFIDKYKISIWYSTPSTLILLYMYGKVDKYDISSLRLILFAGEVFPIQHLKNLINKLHKLDYYNLYGPTETNVCTFFKIPQQIKSNQNSPFPIGKSAHIVSVKFSPWKVFIRIIKKVNYVFLATL